MTRAEITDIFARAGIDSPAEDAILLISGIEGISRADIAADPARDYISCALEKAVERRKSREPLQYILGRWYFMNEEYEVSPECLIPRQETELVAEKAAGLLPNGGILLDLCCGSGCIAVSVMAARPDCRAVAVDLFPETLRVAERNAERNGVADRITFCRADVLGGEHQIPNGRFDVIVSNPPYIRTADIGKLSPELGYEPKAALDGGADGLDFYRSIVGNWISRLGNGGTMVLEIGADQGKNVIAIASEKGTECCIIKDYSGLDRIAVLRKPETH